VILVVVWGAGVQRAGRVRVTMRMIRCVRLGGWVGMMILGVRFSQVLKEMVHPMRRRRTDKKNEKGDDPCGAVERKLRKTVRTV